MLPDKVIKKKFAPIFWKNPDDYYPTEVLKGEGFHRKICPSCKKPFWSTTNRDVCGDPGCSKEFGFIGKSPAKNQLEYVEVWQNFVKMFKKFGYTPINRYPVVSRWNPTMEYTNASIAAFQPYVINGAITPPANPLVIPQFCLRFGDVDNVGITGSHNTGFVMIGQHMFVPPEEWDQNEVFRHIYTWVQKGIGLPKDEVTYHEDAWAGGGNFGCCMEFFSRGCELGNQVYMLYEQTPKGHKELDIKVLDMGMGQERNAWFTQGTNTMYDAIFPTVLKKLKAKTGIKIDDKLMRNYVPYSGMLNLDETDDINQSWQNVAKLVGTDAQTLKENILPTAAMYSVAEHSRSLLVAIADSALPSNVGGGYNLRMILRRALGFIDKYGWDVTLNDLSEWHAKYLNKMYPELSEKLDEVNKILDVEKRKYIQTKKKNSQIVRQVVTKNVTTDKLIELYDSQGITPDEVQSEARKQGIKVEVPENFFGMVAERHEQTEHVAATRKDIDLDLKDVPDTKALYFDYYDLSEFQAVVLKVIDNYVILDQTAFYPTSGGQIHDVGSINNIDVVEVLKQGSVIVHKLAKKPDFKRSDFVHGSIDIDRRVQLAQHHTGTHILNGSAKKVLGPHIWQAGAAKFVDKARLDITHYDNLTNKEIQEIEKVANDVINENIPIFKSFMPRGEAESRYGFTIYQGGAVPGKNLRIVEIPNFDTEACGGTHLNLTGEAKMLKIIKTSKVQDGIVRIEFKCGNAAHKEIEKAGNLIDDVKSLLNCSEEQIVSRVEELFMKWKKAKKAKKKKQPLEDSLFELTSNNKIPGNQIDKACEILRTQPEHLVKTIKRFQEDLQQIKNS